MKLALGRQFHDIESMIGGMEGPDGSVLVAERNLTALKVMESEIKKGKKKLGIFYGAAHLPDFDKRLIEDYGLKGAPKLGTLPGRSKSSSEESSQRLYIVVN